MNLRYLQTFISVAEVGSIARVGARLNVSQPAASRQILALEAELGVHLFDRIGRRLRLTAEGEDLLRQSRRVLMEADLLNARARALKGGHTGILRVGGTPWQSRVRFRYLRADTSSVIPVWKCVWWRTAACAYSMAWSRGMFTWLLWYPTLASATDCSIRSIT